MIKEKRRKPFCDLSNIRLPPSDLIPNKHRIVHALSARTFRLLVLGNEYWRYSTLENKSLKAQYHFICSFQIRVETLYSGLVNCNNTLLLHIIKTRYIGSHTFCVSFLCLLFHLLFYVTLALKLLNSL